MTLAPMQGPALIFSGMHGEGAPTINRRKLKLQMNCINAATRYFPDPDRPGPRGGGCA